MLGNIGQKRSGTFCAPAGDAKNAGTSRPLGGGGRGRPLLLTATEMNHQTFLWPLQIKEVIVKTPPLIGEVAGAFWEVSD